MVTLPESIRRIMKSLTSGEILHPFGPPMRGRGGMVDEEEEATGGEIVVSVVFFDFLAFLRGGRRGGSSGGLL